MGVVARTLQHFEQDQVAQPDFVGRGVLALCVQIALLPEARQIGERSPPVQANRTRNPALWTGPGLMDSCLRSAGEEDKGGIDLGASGGAS
jgi:hypothetical protein